ncbi:unnamed protein product [marine sediment metagenome]|uniref:Uncharacterized protein n=1 Tax=marine sediment metagenome TaxID=412755 RepID=X0UU89_9ZZZZ
MALKDTLSTEFVEKEILVAELVEKELVNVDLIVVDLLTGDRKNLSDLQDVTITDGIDGQVLVLENGIWVNKTISVVIYDYVVYNETPTAVDSLPSAKFETANDFRTDTLQVFLNGQKIHDSEITRHSDTQFSLPLNAIVNDKIEVSYIKKT